MSVDLKWMALLKGFYGEINCKFSFFMSLGSSFPCGEKKKLLA
jgi:hypothetical protein